MTSIYRFPESGLYFFSCEVGILFLNVCYMNVVLQAAAKQRRQTWQQRHCCWLMILPSYFSCGGESLGRR